MKHFFPYPLVVFLFFYQLTSVFAQSTKRVLFIGNSYTHVNNLPQLIADAALSVGDTLIFDSNTPGGHTLLQHSTNTVSQSKIMTGGWHHVVLQGQSQEPITQESNFYTGMTNLNTLIKQYNPCSVPMLYMTWGRKNGDALNCPNIPVMCTYEGMDTTIKRDYMILADWLRTEISPVSVVWKYLRYNYPGINLYQSDDSHPTAEGSYAAACCFYATIFKKNPAFITFNFGLNPADAAIIRNAAKINVFDSLSLWDYKKPPVSGFTYKIGPGINEVIFTNTSQHGDNYVWNFGDNTTSSLNSPTHSYASNGTYTVTLTASNCDLQGLHSSVTNTIISFCNHTPIINPDTLMICPGSSDTLWTQAGTSYQWYNNGIPIPGATNQYLIVSNSFQLVNFPSPSVLTTNTGCSELSKESFVGLHGWMGGSILGFNTVGNVFSGDSVCIGETLKLITSFGEEHVTHWYKNGVAIPFANSDTLIVTNSGAYKCKVTHPTCSNMSSYSDSVYYKFIQCIPVGVKEDSTSLFAGVYPNPASEALTIEFRNTLKKDQLQVFNSLGVLIQEIEVQETITIDISDFPKGLYFIRLKNDQQKAQKFVKH
jgi:hypothetical protein